MKQTLAIALAAVLALSLTLSACNNQTKPGGTSSPPTGGASTSTPGTGGNSGGGNANTSAYPVAGTVGNFYIGGSPGSGGDLNMRTLIRYLEPIMGITLVPQMVDGSRTIYHAVKNAVDAPADGYTFAYQLYPHCVIERYNPNTKDNCFTFDDYYTLCNLVTDSAIIAVRADDPRFADVNNLADLVKYITDNNSHLLISACSVGGDDDITCHKIMLAIPEIANSLTIINGEAVSDGLTSLLGGTLDIFTGNVGDVGTLVEDGSMKVLSVFAEERSSFLPDVATAKECGYDIIANTSRGVVVNKDTDPAILEKIQGYVEQVVNDPAFIEDMKGQGYEVDYLNPTEYRAFLDDEYETLKEVAVSYGW